MIANNMNWIFQSLRSFGMTATRFPATYSTSRRVGSGKQSRLSCGRGALARISFRGRSDLGREREADVIANEVKQSHFFSADQISIVNSSSLTSATRH